jgi:RimJ/RimL family protein N-acetyltransferase
MPFDFQPTMRGALVELRPLRPGDADDLFAVASDPLIWEQHPVRDRYKPDVFSGFFRESLASRGALAALDCKDGRIIGSSRFHTYNAQASEVEIGWTFLARSHWGGSYNREMKQLMLRHAFQFVKRVVFLIGPQNVRSQKAVEKLGAFVSAQDPTPRDEILTSTKSHPSPSDVLNNIVTFLNFYAIVSAWETQPGCGEISRS